MSLSRYISKVKSFVEFQEDPDIDAELYERAEATVDMIIPFLLFADNVISTRSIVINPLVLENRKLDGEWFRDVNTLGSFEHVTFDVHAENVNFAFDCFVERHIRKVTFIVNAWETNILSTSRALAQFRPQEVELIVRNYPANVTNHQFLAILQALPTITSLTLRNVYFLCVYTAEVDSFVHANLKRLNLCHAQHFAVESDFFLHLFSAVPNIEELTLNDGNFMVVPTLRWYAPFISNLKKFNVTTRSLLDRKEEIVYLDALACMKALVDFKFTAVQVDQVFLDDVVAVLSNLTYIKTVEIDVEIINTNHVSDDSLYTFNAASRLERFSFFNRERKFGEASPSFAANLSALEYLDALSWNSHSSKCLALPHLSDASLTALTKFHFVDDSEASTIDSALSIIARCPNIEEIKLHGNFFGITAPPKIAKRIHSVDIKATHSSIVFAFIVLDAFEFPSAVRSLVLSELSSNAFVYTWLTCWFSRSNQINSLQLYFKDDAADISATSNTFEYLKNLQCLTEMYVWYNISNCFSCASLFDALACIPSCECVTFSCTSGMDFNVQDELSFLNMIQSNEVLMVNSNMFTTPTAAKGICLSFDKRQNRLTTQQTMVEKLVTLMENNLHLVSFSRRSE